MVTVMYIANYWLVFHTDKGARVMLRPGAELPAGVPEAEIRALLASGVIRQADAGAMNRAPTQEAAAPKPAKPAKPAKSKPKTEAEQ